MMPQTGQLWYSHRRQRLCRVMAVLGGQVITETVAKGGTPVAFAGYGSSRQRLFLQYYEPLNDYEHKSGTLNRLGDSGRARGRGKPTGKDVTHD